MAAICPCIASVSVLADITRKMILRATTPWILPCLCVLSRPLDALTYSGLGWRRADRFNPIPARG